MADPAIQVAYEVALGRFLVAFNKVDNELAELIQIILTVLNRTDLFDACSINVDFNRKLLVLDLLSLSSGPGSLKSAPISEMRQIAGERNVVAHGHFDQNPFDGNFQLKGKGKYSDYSAERLDGLTRRCNDVWQRLRVISAYYWLDDETTKDSSQSPLSPP